MQPDHPADAARPQRGSPSRQDAGSYSGRDALAQQFSDLARALEQQTDPQMLLADVVRAAVQLIPGCDEGSISVVLGRRSVTSEAASGDLPRIVDALQAETGQGPCLDAAYKHVTVRVEDMATETRWPLFATRAVEAGAAGMLSIQLYVEGDDIGALNLYSRTAGAFTDESEHVGLLFAAHAATAYMGARDRSGLMNAVTTRNLIGQAQGILMERHGLSADQAFALLSKVSQDNNLKLRDVANQLVNSGTLYSPA
ncbi:MAG: GAF and ANTAR domain-containing protein [Mycobacteriales bacterium]|nr:GAF and ANTAR domain-containing protein [Mycobacteriales bacterium]